MIVEISDPARAGDLIAFLRSVACEARLEDTSKIHVTLPDVRNERAARRELELYLAVWEARQTGVRARRRPAYDL